MKGEMTEILPNGESKVIASDEIEESVVESLIDIESQLAFVIAEQTNLKSSDVTVKVSATANSEKKDNYTFLCVVVLSQKDSKLDDETINKVVESMISTISTQDVMKGTIRSEDIVITNSNNDVLY